MCTEASRSSRHWWKVNEMTDFDALIDELAEGAAPVPLRSTRSGRIALAAIAAATLVVVFLIDGFRADVTAARPAPMLSVALGLMLILAIAAGASAVRMARPQVGAAASGAPWALAALLLLPAIALISIAADSSQIAGLAFAPGVRCLAFGLVAGLASLAFLILWLRQGAPVAPERASWLAGLAAGAVGAIAVTLECQRDALAHLGVWHVAVPLVAAGVTRLVLPRFLRW
jgi:hypothetical protein